MENPALQRVFLLLRESLTERDIPSRMTIRRRIEKAFNEHLVDIERDITVGVQIVHDNLDC